MCMVSEFSNYIWLYTCIIYIGSMYVFNLQFQNEVPIWALHNTEMHIWTYDTHI